MYAELYDLQSKKNGTFPTETVEDRAAKDFRNLVRKRGDRQRGRRPGGLMYAASACLVLVLVVMGVSLLNSFDRMQSVQNTLDTLAGATDTVETSGTVTAVTPEDGAGDGAGDSSDEAAGDGTEETAADASSGADDDQTADGQAADTQSADTQSVDAQSADTQSANAQSADAQSEDAQSSDEGSSGDIIVTEGNGSDGVYTVEEGDTLAIISRKMYGDVTHVDAICRMNGITDGNLIYVGQKLLLP